MIVITDTKRVKRDNETVPLKSKTIGNIFENASSSDDENDEVTIDEEEPLNVCLNPVPSEKVLGKCGVWGETFFFQPNDSRLQGKFYVLILHVSISQWRS